MTHEEIVRRYCAAMATQDFATAESLRHREWSSHWPQSGETVTSSEAMREIGEHYPGGPWESVEIRLRGSDDTYQVTPMGTLVRTAGSGDTWAAEWMNRYPDGSVWFVIDIVELRDDRVVRETTYWAAPFDAPPWRREWVDLAGAG